MINGSDVNGFLQSDVFRVKKNHNIHIFIKTYTAENMYIKFGLVNINITLKKLKTYFFNHNEIFFNKVLRVILQLMIIFTVFYKFKIF